MRFLIDEDLPRALVEVFAARGFQVQRVYTLPELRGQPDEVIFDYAVRQDAIIVTADLDFPNPHRFSLHQIPGMLLLRFPNELPVPLMCREVQRLTKNLRDEEFNNLIVIEPGYIRIRAMPRGFM